VATAVEVVPEPKVAIGEAARLATELFRKSPPEGLFPTGEYLLVEMRYADEDRSNADPDRWKKLGGWCWMVTFQHRRYHGSMVVYTVDKAQKVKVWKLTH
jgi:hypothetical protein